MGSFVRPTIDLTQPKLAQENQELNLSSSDLDLKGPLSLRAIYSDELGYMLSGQYTQMLGSNNALSLLLETGKKAHRINATLGHILSLHQRLKLTAEYLTEQKSFEFYSGKEEKWIGQYAYGLGYQYLFSQGLLNDINITTYYSKAQNKILSAKEYIDEGLRYRDYRHIAGGADRSISLGLDVHPFKNTLLGLEANYDNVSYDTLYEHGQDERGLGATLSLHQLLSKKVKLELLASDRKPYQSYGVGVHWLLKSNPGSKLELGLEGKRIIGANSLSNDSQLDVDIGYEWGGVGLGHPSSYMLSNDLCDESWQSSSLLDWVSKPAVYMDQVLAVKDEHRELLGSSVSGGGLLNQDLVTTLYVIVDKGIAIELAKYFSEPQGKGESYKLEGLPDKLSYKEGVIRGKFGKEDVGKSYRVEIEKQAPQDLVQSKVSKKAKEDKKATLLLKVISNRDTPYPTANHPDNPLYFTINKDNEKTYNALWLFNDAESLHNTLELSAEGLNKNANIKWNYYHDAKDESKSTITFSGKPLEAKTYHIKIKARNEVNPPGTWSPETQGFDLIVKDGSMPVIEVNDQLYKDHDSIDKDLSSISVTTGSLSQTVKLENVTGTHAEPLSNYNLETTTNYPDFKHGTIHIKAKAPEGKIFKPTFYTQSFEITAQNGEGSKPIAKKSFTLDIQGSPKSFKPDMGSGSKEQGGQFSLDAYSAGDFRNPTQSGKINDYEFNGGSGEELGLSIDSATGKISGQIKTGAKVGEHQIIVHARNDEIEGYSNDAIYKLTVTESAKPIVNIPPQHFKVNEEVPKEKEEISQYIQAGSGELKEVTSTPGHGLSVELTNDKKVLIRGLAKDLMMDEVDVPIKVINSNDKETDSTFKLGVYDVPHKKGDMEAEGMQGMNDFKYEGTKDHFSHVSYGGELKYLFNGSGTSPDGKVHLNIDERSGVITGTIAEDASTSNPYHFKIKVHDDFGDSVDADFKLSVNKKTDHYYLTPDSGGKVQVEWNGQAFVIKNLQQTSSSDQSVEKGDGKSFALVTSQKIGVDKSSDIKFELYGVQLEGNRLAFAYWPIVNGKKYIAVASLSTVDVPVGMHFVKHPGDTACVSRGDAKECQLEYLNK